MIVQFLQSNQLLYVIKGKLTCKTPLKLYTSLKARQHRGAGSVPVVAICENSCRYMPLSLLMFDLATYAHSRCGNSCCMQAYVGHQCNTMFITV